MPFIVIDFHPQRGNFLSCWSASMHLVHLKQKSNDSIFFSGSAFIVNHSALIHFEDMPLNVCCLFVFLFIYLQM